MGSWIDGWMDQQTEGKEKGRVGERMPGIKVHVQ